MPTVIPVKFRFVTHDLWFNPADTGAEEGDLVICSTERGQEIGLATRDAREVDGDELVRTTGGTRLSKVLRIATDEDLDRADQLAQQGDDALPLFRSAIHELELDMKPVGVEYLFDGGRVVCYFSAEDRVDFRQLVRELSHTLRKRIDMRQIGVREEAALAGGFAHCGQELCCARLGREFEPVSIRMAKEQDLPLNTSKISGACGRLMCCLRYEFDAYKDFKQRAPKRNAVISTPLGKAKIVEYDTPKERICLRLENGKQVRIPLSDMETSDAAVKKSEELHCPCRPDTVTRSALERLQSPEVEMALAELDRAHGLIPEETFADEDIFVSKRQRRRGRGEAPRRQEAQRPQGKGSSEGGQRSRRQRRKAAEGDGVRLEPAASQQGDRTPGPRRRRRHHAGDAGQDQAAGAQAPAGTAQGDVTSGGARPTRRRRRPGDHGGRDAATQEAPGRPRDRAQRFAPDAAPDASDTDKPRRRRRHRGRGRGGSGGTGTQGGGPASRGDE
ncbi:regulatory iron-sulfur-containing complex subunit RicT [Olsenella sp. HMSC062G07]|uniref:PSP1 domain-containing protein n=1 Tax=Olsenella sp. HMSC062G07 TaxID=1739330 RepID=UPI0008A529E5|nr:regulatory iron-sulfur-containing complex subunit RicT [Olsenella sp. HMSC062G07]OFK23529.1 hypothetical protein HMPREF2826_04445 [Olsenella sp. HMSC062G07]